MVDDRAWAAAVPIEIRRMLRDHSDSIAWWASMDSGGRVLHETQLMNDNTLRPALAVGLDRTKVIRSWPRHLPRPPSRLRRMCAASTCAKVAAPIRRQQLLFCNDTSIIVRFSMGCAQGGSGEGAEVLGKLHPRAMDSPPQDKDSTCVCCCAAVLAGAWHVCEVHACAAHGKLQVLR